MNLPKLISIILLLLGLVLVLGGIILFYLLVDNWPSYLISSGIIMILIALVLLIFSLSLDQEDLETIAGNGY